MQEYRVFLTCIFTFKHRIIDFVFKRENSGEKNNPYSSTVYKVSGFTTEAIRTNLHDWLSAQPS